MGFAFKNWVFILLLLSFVESKVLINIDKLIEHFCSIFKKSSKEKFYSKCELEASIMSKGKPAAYILS